LRNKTFDINTKNLIRQIPDASSKEQVYNLLQIIKNTKDKGIEGIGYLINNDFFLKNKNLLSKLFFRLVRLL
jgi:hypothetical protein